MLHNIAATFLNPQILVLAKDKIIIIMMERKRQSSLNMPAGLSELQIGVPWTSTSLLDHKDCNGGNFEVVG